MNEINQDRKLTDCFFFDVASNVQTAGQILCATYPQEMYFHGGDHILSLFFSNISKLKPIEVSPNFLLLMYFILCSCLLSSAAGSAILGSGASRRIYAQLIAQATEFNNEKIVYYKLQEPDFQHGYTQCIKCYVRSGH